MAFGTSISTAIDNIIQQANEVKVCQDHLKLITTSLTRLRHGLNNLVTPLDENHSQEDLIQILKAIDEVVTNCNGNENYLNGMTYPDLESVLLRLHFRLAQHEANITDDYETTVQILSNACQKQQLLLQESFNETMRQRLETIEQSTKKNIIEQLHLLHEKYLKTIESYLRTCVELHKSESPTDLTGDIVAKVTHNSYQISYKERMTLEHKWRSCKLPPTRTFIQFKVDKSTSFERNESRRLLMNNEANMLQDVHSRKETFKGIWERLIATPYMMSMVEKDCHSKEDNISVENILRSKRWIVILGDPRSGKTSFARWLVHHLAQTLLLKEVDSTDYDPLRIPILIRIGEFAEILKEQPSLTLFDYIGKHKWMGKSIIDDSSISSENLSYALQDYIKQGQALIILDGLNEIPVSNERSKIINLIENFVNTYVQIPTGVSIFDNVYLSKLFDDPSRLGGNQLIVTSRIVSYHAAPLAGQFTHYTIQPMNVKQIKDFVDYWFFRVHQRIIDILCLPLVNQGENHSEALKKELEKIQNVDLLDIASNSGLLSSICTIHFSQLNGPSLPTQSILLYESIVKSMLNLWHSKIPTIDTSKVIRILSDIAFYIHQNPASNCIDNEEIKDVCAQTIQASISKTLLTTEDIYHIERQATEMAQVICDDVGILGSRGESLYGFLHLPLQEYFTCLKLINVDMPRRRSFVTDGIDRDNKIQFIVQMLCRHTADLRFRVPITLAFGKISSSWSQNDFNDLCYEFMEAQDTFDSLLPLGAYILINCVNDFVNYPSNDILFSALDRLIIAAGQHKWSIVCPFLFDQITSALKKFPHDIISLWINKLLSQSSQHNIQTITALCHLLEGKPHEFENIQWLDQSSCSILQSLSILDNENNKFAIDRLLVKIAFSNHQLLPPFNPTTFKGFLLDKNIEISSIPMILFPLIIILYGGLRRDGQTVVFDPSHIHRESTVITPILIRFLSGKDHDKQDQSLKKLKQECIKSFVIRMENHDESSEAIDLCIATICFYNIEYIQENLKMISDSLLRMSLNRLKYISMILRQFYFVADENDRSMENETTKFISTTIEKFQYVESARINFLDLLDSLRTSVARLRSSSKSILLEGESRPNTRVTLHLPNSLRQEGKFLNGLLSTDVQFYSDRKSCSILHHFTKLFWPLEHNDELETQYRMAVALDKVPEYLHFRNDEDLLFPLTFVPSHLRNLYVRLLKGKFIMINSKDLIINNRQHLYFGHILIECLMFLSNASCKRLSILSALITLLPWLRMHQLENFGSSLLWTLSIKDSSMLGTFEIKKQRSINYETGQYTDTDENPFTGTDLIDEQQKTIIRNNIEQEYERLQNASLVNDTSNIKLYSASISLAHICHWSEDERKLSLLEQCIHGAMLIQNKLARLDALCIIALYSYSDYDRIKVGRDRSLQKEIEHQLNEIYSNLPLLLQTAIVIRCLPLLQHSQMIDNCLKNLFDKFVNTDRRDQQAVIEALLPYMQLNYIFSSITNRFSYSLQEQNRIIHNKSSLLKKSFNIDPHENLSFSLFISNLYLMELVNDFHECIKMDNRQFIIDESITTKLFQFENCILTDAQALTITNILSFASPTDQSKQLDKLWVILNNALHRINWVEFKAYRLLESWLKWKDSNELSSFAYHAALLLINSDLWSVEATIIVCDLLCNDDDRFRHRAEILFRSSSDNDVRTGSKLGIDVLLTLIKKKVHYQSTSASAKLTLNRMLGNITLDVQSHLEMLLWLERYRIHALTNKKYSFNTSNSKRNAYVTSFFSTDIAIDACTYVNMFRLSGDLIIYMCDMIASNLFSFLEIDGDTTSNTVCVSHTRFVVSVVLTLHSLLNNTDETRQVAFDALMNLFEISDNNEIRQAVACALSYVCNEQTYKSLFEKIILVMNCLCQETSTYSNNVLSALILSYSYCVSINKIAFDQDDMDLFCTLLQHQSQDISKAARTGFGRVLKDTSFLLEMFSFDYIQCYHALIESTACLYLYDVQQNSENAIAKFIEEHPTLLSIFIIETYNSISRFTTRVLPMGDIDYDLAYGYPQYVKIASLIAIQMPVAFCASIKDWPDGDNLKHALFYTSKQHNYPQRAACLTILSLLGELTVDLCEMFIEAVRDDPYIQNTCYKCITRIHSIKDENVVLNLLFSYLKSKSMNVRYITAKILLHLSQLFLIPSKQVQTILNNLMLDPSSNEDLWLIKEQDNIYAECVYYYAGPLKDVIYSLLVENVTGNKSDNVRRNEYNDIDLNFIESEKVSRFASCLYEEKTEENVQ
ncbi:unnamed protein product [Rotaria sordida]|uniref:NACHT domain-containing protein n=1 Tax=Rotaria sordida TaxID=392033 RepID=A0A819N0F5_9BILA|nr:unnamed protein product [Rotaria sordida]CAF1391067.1 unnamed protein product [Rotaria sordida]CAF1603062.1 unnamed protein product [Rotaria sordida]CAF3988041.1 unnamed protein product [Rotaria sordida]